MNTMHRRNNNGGGNGGKMRHNRGGSGGRGYQNNRGGRSNNSNDPGNIQRQKQHSTQMREKYSGLAKDAQMNGEWVDMEYYLQHVEHYSRVLADIAIIEGERYAAQRESQQQSETHQEGAEGQQPSDAALQQNEDGQPPQERQARPARGHYRNRYETRGEPRHEGRSEEPAHHNVNPNANHAEIPLPSSVIPEIPTS